MRKHPLYLPRWGRGTATGFPDASEVKHQGVRVIAVDEV